MRIYPLGVYGKEKYMRHTYEVKGITCGGCAAKVKKSLETVPGVKKADVKVTPPEAEIEMDSHVSVAVLNEALSRSGNYSVKEKMEAEPVSRAQTDAKEVQSLTPLFIIVGYVVGGVLLRAFMTGDFSLHALMGNFMGAFFVVFSLFKMINLSGFADGYSTYDILAKRSRAYALSYPFLELFLGVAYFTDFMPVLTNSLTAVLMAVGSVGVAKALLKKSAIQCACLGTSLKLPMTKVTLAEDVLMGVMALVMLVL
jgi:copper chaperone CopZ